MYRIRKPTTNYENIPVSSMEGPSSPTSVTFWNREFNLCPDNSEIILRKKPKIEKGNSRLFPRVKQTVHKCALAGGHLMGNRDTYPKRTSRTFTDQSRPTSPPSIRFDGNKTVERQLKDTRKAIAEYLKTSANTCPGRVKKHVDHSGMSLSSAGQNARLISTTQNLGFPTADISDHSRDISTANTCSDLPPDAGWTCVNHEGNNKKQVNTKDCIVQTSSCLIKNGSQSSEEDFFFKSAVPKKTYKTVANKSIYSTVRQRPRWQQNTQSSRGRLYRKPETLHTHATSGKRKLKIPDHQIIYMDKLDPNGTQFWAQIASELVKPETQVQRQSKHCQH